MAEGLTEAADLVVEDGTGLDDANSYQALAAITSYVTLRQDVNLLPWLTANESNQVAAAIIAVQYLDLRWRYRGAITYDDTDDATPQRLQWPRTGVFDDRFIEVGEDELPERLTDAHAEYAARAISPTTFQARQLFSDLETEDTAGRRIKETFKKVGPLVTQTKYMNRGSRKYPSYGMADEIIRRSGFLASAGERTVRG